ncbi:hypothetical protein H1R20_g1408, partial [Candolleomyces eurysporus]
MTPQDSADLPGWLLSLGNALQLRSDRTDDIADLTQSISAKRKALELTPLGHSRLPSVLYNLGATLYRHFGVVGDMSSVDEAIRMQVEAVELTAPGDVELAKRFIGLAISYIGRFNRTGQPSDLDNALKAHENAQALTPQGHPQLSKIRSSLGDAYHGRFLISGAIQDINEAIFNRREAVKLIQIGHKDRPYELCALGRSIVQRYQHQGAGADLEESIPMMQEAIGMITEDEKRMPEFLVALGIALMARYEHREDMTDLEESISILQKSVSLTREGDPSLPERLNSLGSACHQRFKHSRDFLDIREAIEAKEKAVALTPADDTRLTDHLNNLGNSYQLFYQVARDFRFIEQAISVEEKAIAVAPAGHAKNPSLFNNLSNSLLYRFDHTKDLSDIDKAISLKEEAIALCPPDHADLHSHIKNLGSAWRARFEATQELADIDKAIFRYRESLELIPPLHSSQQELYDNTAYAFYIRSFTSNDNGDTKEAIAYYRLAATSSAGSARAKLEAADKWALVAQKRDRSDPEVLEAFDVAVNLWTMVGGLEKTVQHRHEVLQGNTTFILKAAAVAFEFGRTDKALEWLEQGRCVVWNQINHLRSPLGALRHHDENLADRVLQLSKMLELAGSRERSFPCTIEEKMSLQQEVKSHTRMVKEWDELLATIHGIPGFEDFLQPTSYSQLLRHLPQDGSVVVINVHRDRCDALALSSEFDQPKHIPLPEFSDKQAERLHHRLQKRLAVFGLSGRQEEDNEMTGRAIRALKRDAEGQDVVQDVLSVLWKTVVKPILDCMGLKPSDSPNKRIWWCTTGHLIFLPIHAAGIYDGTVHSTLFDYAVSSYIPTVSSLSNYLKKPRTIDSQVEGVLMVSQPNASGRLPLPGAKKEIELIHKVLKPHSIRCSTLESANATIEAVRKNMEDFTCIHFACHASQHPRKPFRSCFHLHDGPLELSRIIQSNLESADLAFLSACQTSAGDETLSEEAVHLAAGMMAAGYRSVVATMWTIRDEYAPGVAESFYRNLLGSEVGGRTEVDSSSAAFALHRATQELRMNLDALEASFLVWVPYVHFGL